MVDVTIVQEIDLPGSPQRVYQAYTESSRHAEFTGLPAEIEPRVGGSCLAGDGYITGAFLDLVPGKRISQTWHASDFPEGHMSQLELDLEPVEGGTLLRMTHSGVPEEAMDMIDEGWHRHYWEPLRAYLEKG